MSLGNYRWLLGGIILALVACDRDDTSTSLGSDTNWLACESGDDCRADSLCNCGVCTKACETSEQCSSLPGALACLEVTELLEDGCRIGFSGAVQGICVPACESTVDCPDSMQCVSGACVPRVAITPDGPVSGLPVDGGQASIRIPATENTAGTLADDEPLDAGAPDTGVLSDTTDRLDAQSPDSGQGYVFPELLPWFDTGITPDTPPQLNPEYDAGKDAFIGGVPPGERAPVLGEVPGNVYGGPTVPWGPYSWGFLEGECNKSGGGTLPMVSPEGGNACISYDVCRIDCSQDSDCNDGGSGNAIPRCNQNPSSSSVSSWYSGVCLLICDSDTICPDGMACVRNYYAGDSTNICMWPLDIAEPGCPAWCELDPLPKGCPGWCAVAGVGCEPEAEGYCCEGLVCGSEGWCVEESEQ